MINQVFFICDPHGQESQLAEEPIGYNLLTSLTEELSSGLTY